MVVFTCLHGRRDSTHLGDGKCIYHFTPLAKPRVGDLVLIIDYLCFLLKPNYIHFTSLAYFFAILYISRWKDTISSFCYFVLAIHVTSSINTQKYCFFTYCIKFELSLYKSLLMRAEVYWATCGKATVCCDHVDCQLLIVLHKIRVHLCNGDPMSALFLQNSRESCAKEKHRQSQLIDPMQCCHQSLQLMRFAILHLINKKTYGLRPILGIKP